MNLGRAATPLLGHVIRTIVTIDQTAGARLGSLPQIQNWRNHDARRISTARLASTAELIPDFLYESHYEFVSKLA